MSQTYFYEKHYGACERCGWDIWRRTDRPARPRRRFLWRVRPAESAYSTIWCVNCRLIAERIEGGSV